MARYRCALDLCLKSGKLDKVLIFAENIQKNIPDESEIKSYASQRFCKQGFNLFNSNNYKAAFYFLKSALLFDPSNEDLQGFCTFVNSANDAMREVDLIQQDENIILPIKSVVATSLQLELKVKTKEEVDGVVDVAYESLGEFSEDAILNSIDSVESDYPGHWIIAKQSLLSIREIVNGNRIKRANRQSKPEPLLPNGQLVNISQRKPTSKPKRNHSRPPRFIFEVLVCCFILVLGVGLFFSIIFLTYYLSKNSS